MPTRLLLEGDDLAALMHQVRDEIGPGARVVRAERVRTGGVAGFFARERYELTIEVPDARPPARPAARPPAAGIDALLAAADAAEREDAGAEPAGPVEAPTVSTAGPAFADVLASMRRVVGGAPSDGSDAQAGPGPGDTAADGPVHVEVEVLDVVAADVSAGPTDPTDPEPDPVGPGVGAVTVAGTAVEPDRPTTRSGSSVTALLELGVPTRLLSGIGDPDVPVPLSVLVRRFDRPPTARLLPGSVVAVAGPPDLALRTATQIAQRAGIEPRDVVLAGDVPAVAGHGRRLQTASALARFRSRVPDDVPTVVALGVSAEPDARSSAAELLHALDPHQAWAAVDARHRSADLRRWVRAVGARRAFDALAVCNTFQAQAPGTVLTVGTPVGWVDGLPATPVVWAAVLSERLADDALWD